jgi:O-antigen/teichoic acid export membrane protein
MMAVSGPGVQTGSLPVIGKLLGRVSPLLIVNLYDSGVPFIRMLLLSRFLDLRELGFASVLTAVYATFELITDINISRFVLSAPREDYEEALAAAHALSALRGLLVAFAIVALAPIIAAAFSLGSQWLSFAALAPIVVLRSLEHLGPRIAEREYRYGPQLKVATVAYGVGLAALFGSIVIFANHLALIASLFGQMVGLALATRIFSSTPYRWRFRTPLFAKAFNFGYPLMFNGLGLAVSAQADRFLVGAMLGLPALGVYSVLMLVTVVPVGVGVRIANSVTLATLFNRIGEPAAFEARLRLASRAIPLAAAVLGAGVLALINIVVPLVFGRNFLASQWMIVFLAFGAFFRMARCEPGTAILMIEGRTKRLALANLIVGGGLIFTAAFLAFAPTIEAATLGRCLGDVLGLAAMLYLTRSMLKAAIRDNILALGLSALVLCVGSVFVVLTSVGNSIAPSLAFLSLALIVLGLLGLGSRPLLSEAGFAVLSRNAVPDGR